VWLIRRSNHKQPKAMKNMKGNPELKESLKELKDTE
jgi:hypothetical protein